MIVYIEYVLINNFIIDYIIISLTFKLNSTIYKKWRVVVLSIVGAGISLIFPLVNFPNFIVIPLKILVGFLILLLSAKFNTVKNYYFNILTFFLLTMVFGGICYAIINLFNIDLSSNIVVSLMFLPIYFLSKFILIFLRSINNKVKIKENILQCEFFYNDKSIVVNGLMDTGNCLYFENQPLIVVSKNIALKIIDITELLNSKKYIKYDTINGKGKMRVFKIDKMKIYFKDKDNTFSNVMIGVLNRAVGNGFDVILHRDLIKNERREKNETNKNIEKVS